MEIGFIITVFIVGALLLLSFLHLGNVTGVNRRANALFGIFSFQWSTFWLDEFVFPESLTPGSEVFIVVRFFQFLVPITFILSVKFYTNPNVTFGWKDAGLFIVPALFLLFLIVGPTIGERHFNLLYIVIFLVHSLFYTILANVKIVRHQKNIKLFHSNTSDIDLRWIKYITYSFIGTVILIIGYHIFTKADTLNTYINLVFLGVVYLVAFYSIRQKEIYPKGTILPENVPDSGDPTKNTSKNKLLSKGELDILKGKLLELMQKEEPYLDSDLNLIKLSEQMQLSSHQLSYLINTGFNENFFNFINRYRVQKAAELLKNPDYDHLNILAIGYESGFNSKTSFNTTFKKMTSYTPTEYRRLG